MAQIGIESLKGRDNVVGHAFDSIGEEKLRWVIAEMIKDVLGQGQGKEYRKRPLEFISGEPGADRAIKKRRISGNRF